MTCERCGRASCKGECAPAVKHERAVAALVNITVWLRDHVAAPSDLVARARQLAEDVAALPASALEHVLEVET